MVDFLYGNKSNNKLWDNILIKYRNENSMTDKEKVIKELKETLDSLDITNKYRLNVIRAIEYLQKEPISEDLGEYINELSKQFQEVSFAKLSRIAVRVAKWQKEQMMAKAFEAEVLENYDGKVIKYDDTILDEKLSDCKVFDKVKVIVIKNE